MTIVRSQARSDFVLKLLIACTGLIIMWALHSLLSEVLQGPAAPARGVANPHGRAVY